MKSLNNNQTGFTIMEVVVATGIFAVLVVAIFGIFTSVLDAQQNTLAQVRLEREAQLVMETVSRKIRSSRVDYAAYETILGIGNPIPSPTSTLILIDQADSRVRFQLDTASKTIDLQIDSGQTNPVTTDAVDTQMLDFFITPGSDPFVGGLRPSEQPRVTVVMTLTAAEGDQDAQVTVQQTIPQRGTGF